ncbi:MAG: winged helix-turn-helix domain-containing protein [Colwellia sp.]|nr:winged helix-turn-helix domain-containing protein [Colwellia sp.]
MATQLKSCNRVIHVHQQLMIYNDVSIKIRPKTFSLLILFLQHPFEVLSKQTLLDTIWDDVEVNEQVLFQTIRELRQLFDADDVIKTHPRKGYAWVVDVEDVSIVTQQKSMPNDSHIATKKIKAFPWQQLIIMLILLVVTGYYTFKSSSTANDLSGTLVILPMKTLIDDNDHQWVYLGAMNQLISRLVSNDTLVVLSTNFVLTIMDEAELNKDYQTKNVRRIFDVSGASLIVETQLSGSTQNYQLNYQLHFKHDIKRGVIFERNINNAIIKLAKIVSSYSGHSLIELGDNFNSEFSNELLVRALELKEQDKHLAASQLLESLILVEPNNIVARDILANSYLRLSKVEQAKEVLLTAIKLAEDIDSNELPIVYHHLAVAEFISGDLPQALKLLETADKHAITKHDWLFRAYNAQLKSRINIRQNNLEQAHNSLNNALKYHGVIQCPVGTSITLLQLSDLAEMRDESKQSIEYFNRASKIINDRNLSFLKNRLTKNSRKLI